MSLAQSTHTVSDIATAVKRQFGDESGTQINNVDIIRWINQGQGEIVRRGEVNKGTATTPSVAGQNTYTFTDNIYKILALFYNNTPMDYISFEQAQQSVLYNPDSVNIEADPTNWFEYDDSITLYPTPVRSGDILKLYAIKAPTAVTSTGDILSLPDTHYQALLDYVLMQAYQLDDNFNSAGVMGSQMSEKLTDLMDTASYQSYPTITVMPEDA